MKLSEAIRLGAMLHRQGFMGMRKIVELITGELVIVTCALGAASNAGYRLTITELNTRATCPAGCPGLLCLASVITHLNDYHEWTRERIADWVQMVEEQQAVDSERQQALTMSTDGVRGTTAVGQPVLTTRA